MRVLRRKKKKKGKNNIWRNKKLLLFLVLSYSAHLYIDVHCSNRAKKKSLAPLLEHVFWVFEELKISILLFSTTAVSALIAKIFGLFATMHS